MTSEASAEIRKNTTLEERLATLEDLVIDLDSIRSRIENIRRKIDGSVSEDGPEKAQEPASPKGHLDRFSYLLDSVREKKNSITDTLSILEEYI